MESTLATLNALIVETLRPYVDVEGNAATISQKTEKSLLISLTCICRRIEQLKFTVDSYSDSDADQEEPEEVEGFMLRSDHFNSSMTFLTELISLLALESQYVKHLVGNIIVSVAQCLSSSLKAWESFVHSLFVVLELMLGNLLHFPSRFSREVNLIARNPGFVDLNARIKISGWCTAGIVIRVIRNLLKYQKREPQHQRLEVFLVSMTSLLSEIPWECWRGNLLGQDNAFQAGNSENQRNHATSIDGGGLDPAVAFVGNFIQSICSLVGQTNYFVEEDGSFVGNSFICIVIRVIPQLLSLSLGKQGVPRKDIVAHYFKHKVLMLMLRLTSQSHLDCNSALSWLELLHDNLEDVLKKSIVKEDSYKNELLEGSPFVLSAIGAEAYDKYTIHLQRYTILLFLRCCVSNIRSRSKSCEHSFCSSSYPCCNFYPSRDKGLLELYQWIKNHVSVSVTSRGEINVDKCTDFSRSFLQLYMHEDDTLFQVLLELSYIKSSLQQPLLGDGKTFDNKEELVYCFDLLFSPLTLFHIFLQEMHYDHQVLISCLISKDSGISCAQYLLRSLRAINDSWPVFTHFPSSVNTTICQLPDASVRTDQESSGLLRSSSQQDDSSRKPFLSAKDCLQSLEQTLNSLRGDGLFPYNPDALLKRLRSFQEMCANNVK